jgi:erythromycin esterase-like protein
VYIHAYIGHMDKKLIKAARAARIIGVGEATHGGANTQQWIFDAVKKCMRDAGYTVFVMEASIVAGDHLNMYLQGKQSLESALVYMYNNSDYTAGFVDLMRWMRGQNDAGANLEVMGIDIYAWCSCKYHSSKARAGLKKLVDEGNAMCKKHKQHYPEWNSARDLCMYRIFMRRIRADKRYIFSAHMGHISKRATGYTSVGVHLAKRFKSEYIAIAISFYRGQYLCREIRGDMRMYYKTGWTTFTTKEFEFPPGIHAITPANKQVIPRGMSTCDLTGPTILMSPIGLWDYVVVLSREKPIRPIAAQIHPRPKE